jgi:hypothetical protein
MEVSGRVDLATLLPAGPSTAQPHGASLPAQQQQQQQCHAGCAADSSCCCCCCCCQPGCCRVMQSPLCGTTLQAQLLAFNSGGCVNWTYPTALPHPVVPQVFL